MARLELATNPIPISIVAVKGFPQVLLFLSDALPTELHAHFYKTRFLPTHNNLILCCFVSLIMECMGLEPMTIRL